MQTITQTHFINATPEEVFLAITNPLTIELWSGYPAVMEAREDFEFSLFEGDITGRNLKVIPGRQLTQEWYFGDTSEQSLVTITLSAAKNKTRAELVHTNVPDEVFEEFREGWKDYYWGAIIKFFK
jgi:activator of HSP90 ATPase